LDTDDLVLRPGSADDLPAITRIQDASPEAAHWNVREYLEYDLVVAARGAHVVGFAVARSLAEGETELLNLAVDPAWRRQGIGRRLVLHYIWKYRGALWLEVRRSNAGARKLYESLAFSEHGERRGYYSDSRESAIVMNFHS